MFSLSSRKLTVAKDSRQRHMISPSLRYIKDGVARLKNANLIIDLVLIALPEGKVDKKRETYPVSCSCNGYAEESLVVYVCEEDFTT